MKRTTLLAVAALVVAQIFAGPLDQAWIKGTTDKVPLDYKVGESMTFTLTPMKVGALTAGEWQLEWDRTGDDGVVEKGKFPFDGKTPFVYKTKIDKPGFVRLRAFVVGKDGKRYKKQFVGDATTPEGRKAMNEYERSRKEVFFDGSAGAGASALKITGVPDDLAEYWKTFDERLAKTPMHVERALVRKDAAGYEIYAVSVQCAGVFPVTGYLYVPPKGRKYPARLETHGYGGNVNMHTASSRHYRDNEIVFNVNPFGIRLLELGGTEADRKALWWAVHDGKKTGHGFSRDQNEDRDTAFFNGMVLRVKRALQYLKTLPEWNGKDLYASGGSQGGLQTIWAAACGEGVTRAESTITWCCDMYTNGKLRKDPALKMSSDGWYIEWTPAMGYYDAAIVSTLIPKTCQVIVPRAGLGDYCCPPTGLVKMFNAMTCPRKFHWMQGSEHGYVPPAYEGRDVVREAK